MAKKFRYDVLPGDGGWIVKGSGDRASGIYCSKAEAIGAARSRVEKNGGELRIHDKRGQVLESYTVGRESFQKISAVEGIRPTKDASRRAAEFDRKGLPPEERRRAIIEAHRSKS